MTYLPFIEKQNVFKPLICAKLHVLLQKEKTVKYFSSTIY